MAVLPDQFKQVLAQMAAGVTVVTTRAADGQPIGVTASSFTSVSLDPPLVLVCLQKRLFAHAAIIERGTFAVSVLNVEQVELGMRFAGLLPHVEDRFAGLPVTTAMTGNPILPDCLAWVDCDLWNLYDGGDHSILVGEVLAASTAPRTAPLLYHARQWCRSEVLPPHALLAPQPNGATATNGHR